MRSLFILLLLHPMLALAQTRDDVVPWYSQQFKEHYTKRVAHKPSFAPGTPLEPTVVSTSPHRYATVAITRTDGTKDIERVAYITITSKHFPPIYLEAKDFRTITATWVTDRVLFLSQDIGHIAGIEELFDVIDRKWLSRQSVSYEF